MTHRHSSRWIWQGLFASLLLALFTVDTLMPPRDLSAWLLYLPVCITATWLAGNRVAVVTTAMATVMIIIGRVLSGATADGLEANAARFLEIVAIWLTLALAIAVRRNQQLLDIEKHRDQLALFIENAPHAIAMLDKDMRYLAASRQWRDDYSLRGPLVGRSHYEVFPEIGDDWKAVHRRCLAGASEQSQGEKFVRADGSVQWLRWDVRPWRYDTGEIGGVLISSEDITIRKQAEAQLGLEHQLTVDLAKSEMDRSQLSGIIIGNTEDAIICCDARQRITMFNRGAERAFGMTAHEALGQHLNLLLPQRYAKAHTTHFGTFADGPVQSRRMSDRDSITCRRKDGTEFPAEISISKFATGDGYGYAAIMRDISSRQKAEELLRRERRRLGLALQAGRMGTFQIDEPAGVLQVDEAAARLIGLDQAHDIPLSARFQNVHPDDRPLLLRTAIEMRHGKSQTHLEFRFVHQNGNILWCGADALAEYDEGGDLRRTTGVMYDISERKELERTLEERVAKRTQDLSDEVRRREQAQADLLRSQKLQAVGELAGGIAHDFNNLLTVISGNLELLSLRSLDHKARDLIRRASAAANMGARLSNRLLAFGRRQSLHPTNIDLGDIVNSMMEVLKRSLGATIEVEAQIEPGLWPARADVSEVENAILNLAINARDAMPNGGKLVIQIANASLGAMDVSSEAGLVPGEYVMLSVSDNGVGISPENLPRVFEPYFTTKQPGRGTGLGLSTIYGFAKQSGGHVKIDSEVGRGTTVSLYLPRANGARSTAEVVPAPAAAAAEGETVLIVEDNPEVRDVTIKRLDMLGYQVLSAEDAPTAIGILKGNTKVDIVFSDVVMPGGMTGFDLVKWVRANRPAIRLLLTSGFTGDISQTSDAGEMEGMEGIEILRKPYATTDLARALRHALT